MLDVAAHLDPAGDDARPVLHGDLRAHDARLDARGRRGSTSSRPRAPRACANSVIQRRHVLRNALLPVVTLAGLQAGTLVGGAVLTETVFAWPGIGRLMYEALLQRDYNLLLGVFVVCSAMVLVFNLDHRPGLPRWSIRASSSPHETVLANRCCAIPAALIGAGHPDDRDRWSRCSGRCCFPTSPWRMVQRPFLPPFTLPTVSARHRRARPRRAAGHHLRRARLAAGRPGLDAGGAGGRRSARRDRRLFRRPDRRRADALHRVLPDRPELCAGDRAGRDPAALDRTRSSRAIAIVSAGRRWRGWCAARCCRCARANMSRPPSSTGQTSCWIIWREILPNALSPVIVLASLMVATAILLESSLSFLGLGDPNLMSLGLHGRRRPHRDPPGLVDHGVSRARHPARRCWRST